MKRLIPLLFLLSALSWGQSTNITLQVTDVGGQTWNNGSWSVQLVSQPGASNQGPPFLIKGTATPVANQTLSGTLSGTGGASLSLVPNASITPAQSTWRFVVCPNATIDCYRQSVIVAGASQNVNLTPPTIQISGQNGLPPNVIAYTDSEIISPAQGAQYFNTISLAQRQWTGSAWVTIGNSANVSCGTIGAIVRQSAIGPIFVCDPNATLDGNGLLGVTGINVNGAGNGTIDFLGGTAPSNPTASHCKLYFDTGTGFLSAVNSSGASCIPSGGGGSTAWGSLTFPNASNTATFGANKVTTLTNTAGTVTETWIDRGAAGFAGIGWGVSVFNNTFTNGVLLTAYEDSTVCNGITYDGGVLAVQGPLGGPPIFCAGMSGGGRLVTFPDGSTWDASGSVKMGPTNTNLTYLSTGKYVIGDNTGFGGFLQLSGESIGGGGYATISAVNGAFTVGAQTQYFATSQTYFSVTFGNGLAITCNLACTHGIAVDGSTGQGYSDVTPATGDNSAKIANTAFVQDKGGTGSVNNFAQYDASNRLTDSSKAKPSGAVVGTTDAQTLTNKILTNPTIQNGATFQSYGGTGTSTGATVINNATRVFAVNQFNGMTGVTKLQLDIAVAGTGTDTYDVGLYGPVNGTAAVSLACHTGATLASTLGFNTTGFKTVTFSACDLPIGEYYFAWTGAIAGTAAQLGGTGGIPTNRCNQAPDVGNATSGGALNNSVTVTTLTLTTCTLPNLATSTQ